MRPKSNFLSIVVNDFVLREVITKIRKWCFWKEYHGAMVQYLIDILA